jgi:uncharacterized protein (TIGR02147 family)
MSINIFDYLDYRQFLRDFYEFKKKENPYFSYRFMSGRVGLDAGYLVKVLQGKYHIAEKSIEKFVALCKLNEKEAEYFTNLVYFSKAKSEKSIKLHFEKLLSLKKIKANRIEEFQYEFYQKWYYSAIRSLLGFYDFSDDFKQLSDKLSPRITVKQARDAMRLLEKLNFVKKEADGRYALTDELITTGEEWRSIAIKQFQRETINLASESLDRHNKDHRDISTVTMAVSQSDIAEIKEIIKEFRSSILKLVNESTTPDTVYQLNVQLFPMTEVEGKKA